MGASVPTMRPGDGEYSPSPALVTELEWLESQYRLRAVDIAATPAGAVSASRQVINGGALRLCGWSVVETTGTASAAVRLRDGAGATDQVMLRIDLAPSESTRDYLHKHGLGIETGMLWLEVISGSVEGTVWVR